MRGCNTCTSIAGSLIDAVALRRCRSAQRHRLAAELVLRFAANTVPAKRYTRTTALIDRAAHLAAMLFVLVVPAPAAKAVA